MACNYTGRIAQSQDSMEFWFPGYRIVVDFNALFPRLGGAWLPVSLFRIHDDHNFLLLEHSNIGSFWLLDADFNLVDNDHCHMRHLLKDLAQKEQVSSCDYVMIKEVSGLLSHCDNDDKAAFDAFVKACDAGELQYAGSYSALVQVAARLGRLSDILPLVEAALKKPGFFTLEQAARPEAWLGRAYADQFDFARAHKLLAAAIAGSATPPDWMPDLIDWCARRDTTAEFGNPPELLLHEVAEFGRAALDFLAGRHCVWHSGRYPTITVARHWIRRTVKVIHLEPSDAEMVAQVRAGGISPTFLQAAIRGREGVGEACFAACLDVPFAADPAILNNS